MNQKIQLSIAIPVYNGEKNLKSSLIEFLTAIAIM